jgi:DNA-binding transcriptional regulator YiaG
VFGVTHGSIVAWEKGFSIPRSQHLDKVYAFLEKKVEPSDQLTDNPTIRAEDLKSDIPFADDPTEPWSRRIYKFRSAFDLTQQDLAAALKVTPAMVCHWEKGLSDPCKSRRDKLFKIFHNEHDAPKVDHQTKKIRDLERHKKWGDHRCPNPYGCRGSDEGHDDPLFEHYLRPSELPISWARAILIEVLTKQHLTNRGLARILIVPEAAIGRWLSGRGRPSPRAWAALIRVLLLVHEQYVQCLFRTRRLPDTDPENWSAWRAHDTVTLEMMKTKYLPPFLDCKHGL